MKIQIRSDKPSTFQQIYFLAIFCDESYKTLQWRHRELHGVLNYQNLDCLLNRIVHVFRV